MKESEEHHPLELRKRQAENDLSDVEVKLKELSDEVECYSVKKETLMLEIRNYK